MGNVIMWGEVCKTHNQKNNPELAATLHFIDKISQTVQSTVTFDAFRLIVSASHGAKRVNLFDL